MEKIQEFALTAAFSVSKVHFYDMEILLTEIRSSIYNSTPQNFWIFLICSADHSVRLSFIRYLDKPA